MYVHRIDEEGTHTVGYYDPSGEWVHESAHESHQAALERVAWLNGRKLPRKRPGRPPRHGVPMVNTGLRLTPWMIERCTEYGHGKAVNGIRQILAEKFGEEPR